MRYGVLGPLEVVDGTDRPGGQLQTLVLATIATLPPLGWNKALDIVETPDPEHFPANWA